MSDKQYWYGYLEAGSKSSPVLRDNRLDTGNPETLYLFNLNRGEVLEYKRTIIESKLRDLGSDEKALSKSLKAAYIEARNSFIPRGDRAVVIPSRGGRPVSAANDERREVELPDDDNALLDDEEWMEEA